MQYLYKCSAGGRGFKNPSLINEIEHTSVSILVEFVGCMFALKRGTPILERILLIEYEQLGPTTLHGKSCVPLTQVSVKRRSGQDSAFNSTNVSRYQSGVVHTCYRSMLEHWQ